MNKYFVSYNYASGYGHSEVSLDGDITGIDVIRRIASSIEHTNKYPAGSVIIINFRRFEEEQTTEVGGE